ncbi:MAG: DNA repair protein RecN [Alphaproteobacteria bacterium]|nr:DNA repair protein RecN [Alphaproteobacteria bacterium]
MLASLTIHNIVLIDRLTLEGEGGLAALTGETGAGKSILLDALGLALGARSESGLVRHGAEQAAVTACFDLPARHPAHALLKEKGLPSAETLILRRTLGKDGRSKAFINDEPVSMQLLREIGATLVEVHGQFETQGLLDPQTHSAALDSYAGLSEDAAKTRQAWAGWRTARERLEAAETGIESMRLQEEYLKDAVAELEKLSPQRGEEEILAEKRHFLLHAEKMRDGLSQATEILESDDGVQSLLGRLHAALGRIAGNAGERMTAVMETLARAESETSELAYQIEALKSTDSGDGNLAAIEDRYFALRECAKKHRCTVDQLPKIHEDLSQKLRLITHHDDTLAELRKNVGDAREKFVSLAERLSAARARVAQKIGKAVNAELPALKLDKATFSVAVTRAKDESAWGPNGLDKVQFTVATNPQTPAGPIHKIASGGELSRFMLALKLILAETSSIPTLVFDEVDSGIGGATADAVGERLSRLAKKYQVLVVTHSPQVAARAAHHWIVAKTAQKGTVITKITPLKALEERQEEIARMISGAKVTSEARAAAAKLLEHNVA